MSADCAWSVADILDSLNALKTFSKKELTLPHFSDLEDKIV